MLTGLSIALITVVLLLVVTQLRFLILCLFVRPLKAVPATEDRSSARPQIAIHIATLSEALVLPPLLQAIRGLDWPARHLTVYVLDDSTGEDAAATAAVVNSFVERGLCAFYINRGQQRRGFKAGALNHGIAVNSGAQLIAYFDVDFIPRTDFLSKLVPYFSDEGVAAVQSRWEFSNRKTSPLTAAQSCAFEYLFRYEYGVRSALGAPVYFLGSAGVWRRDVLEQLGGWCEEPFTAEDVDMSYRTAAANWKIMYEPSALADVEAIENLLPFRRQQRRWARAVGRAAFDAMRRGGLGRRSFFASIIEWTALLPHATLPLTLVATLLMAILVLNSQSPSFAIEVLFFLLVSLPPSTLALVVAVRTFHPTEWFQIVRQLAFSGPVAAMTMTSFLFGLFDLAYEKRPKWNVTPKSGEQFKKERLGSHISPLIFEGLIAAILSAGVYAALQKKEFAAVVPIGGLALAYAVSASATVLALARSRLRE